MYKIIDKKIFKLFAKKNNIRMPQCNVKPKTPLNKASKID